MDKRKKKSGSSLFHKIMVGLGSVLCVLFGFLLVCNLTIIIKGSLHPDEPPSVFGVTPMVTLSGSMSGTQAGHIEVGDLIFVGKAEAAELEEGDVITFKDGSMIVTHRIQEVQTAEDGSIQWITKGDANNAPDTEPVNEKDLVGQYKFRLPKVGDFALFLKEPMGMLLFIGVPLLAFIIYDILRRQHYATKEKTRTAQLEAELKQLRALQAEKEEQKL